MSYRVLTVSREFGSGGGRIAKTVADWMGWKLLDSALIDAIACAAHVEPREVSHYDEHVESWLRRLNRQAMRATALAAGFALDSSNCFDPDVMTELTRQIVEQAHATGECVIVGRGAQCILQRKTDTFHVFVYAPFRDRLLRLRARLGPGIKVESRMRAIDEERAQYLQQRFAKRWNDPHLYDLMIASHEDETPAARLIYEAMTGQSRLPLATA
jgi:cytidylate kinase